MDGDGVKELGAHLGLQAGRALLDQPQPEMHVAEQAALLGRPEGGRAAELADDLGYDSFWVPEAWGHEVFSVLTEMALRTKRIKLGTGMVSLPYHNPLTAANRPPAPLRLRRALHTIDTYIDDYIGQSRIYA